MKRRLERTRRNNILAGVCGGIAKYFNIDVTVVRAIWILSAVFGGPGLGIYIICAIIIPKERYDEEELRNEPYDEDRDERSRNYMGLALIGLGVYMALKIFLPAFTFKFFWPVILIGGGILLLTLRRHEQQEEDYE